MFVFESIGISEAIAVPLLGIFALMFLFPCMLAAVLWLFPATVTGQTSTTRMNNDGSAVSAQQLLLVGFSLLGAYAIIFGTVKLLYYEALQMHRNAYAASLGIDNPEIVAGTFASRLTNVTQVVFGLVLALGRRGLSRAMMKIKYGGVNAH